LQDGQGSFTALAVSFSDTSTALTVDKRLYVNLDTGFNKHGFQGKEKTKEKRP
jgi:hypothetical protein